MKHKVSVLVPVYNTEKTLERCLDSIINQTLNDIEIIITNDGSNDNSQMIIEKYSKIDNRIKYYTQHNSGLGATRNKGIDMATGEYIAFLDSDDWVDKDYYEKMYNKAKENDSDLVISSYFVEMKNSRKSYLNKYNYKSCDKHEYLIKLLEGKISGFSWNKIYKREFINNNNLRFPLRGELENVEDQYFSSRCVYFAENINFMNESNVHYFVNSNSIVQKYQSSLFKDIVALYNVNLSMFNSSSEYISSIRYNLLNGFIGVINNEFKPNRVIGYKEKIKKIKEIKEYIESSADIEPLQIIYTNKLDKLYFKLLMRDKIITLYLVAKLRCKVIYWRMKIND